jgi:hypothetical protein
MASEAEGDGPAQAEPAVISFRGIHPESQCLRKHKCTPKKDDGQQRLEINRGFTMKKRMIRTATFVGNGAFPLLGTLMAGAILTVTSLLSV